MYGAALYRLRKEDFSERAASRRHLAGLADQLRRDGAVLHQGRADVPRARRPRRGSDRAAGQRAVSLSAGVARAADREAGRRSGTRRLPAVSFAVRHHARRDADAVQPLRPLHRLRRVPLPRARQERRRGARRAAGARASERDAGHQRDGDEAGDERGRHGGDQGRRATTRASQEIVRRAGIVVVSCGAANSAKLLLDVGQRQASARARQRLGPGRPELHVPQQPGGARVCRRSRTPRSTRRRSG